MTEAVLIALITTMGGVMVALVAKVNRVGKDSAAARTASERAESSLNNSPHTITERLLGMTSALADIKTAQTEHGKDIRGVREDIGILQGADRSLRLDLADHLEASKKTIKQSEQTAATVEKLLPDIHRLIDNRPQTPQAS